MQTSLPRYVKPKRRRLWVRLLWSVIWGLLGSIAGLIAVFSRQQIDGPLRVEMLISWLTMLGLSLLWIALHWRVPVRHITWDLLLGLTLLWGGFWAGSDGLRVWSGEDFSLFGFLSFAVIHWLAALLFGTILIREVRANWPVSEGPYCPRCRYCVIGVRERRCPECGRPFTLRELGVTAEELEP